MPRGLHPVGRPVVLEPVLRRDRRAELGDRLVGPAATERELAREHVTRDPEHDGRGVVAPRAAVHRGHGRHHLLLLGLGLVESPERAEGDAARIVPERPLDEEGRARLGLGEDLLPAAEPDEDVERLGEHDVRDLRLRVVERRGLRDHGARRLERRPGAALHHARERERVPVVDPEGRPLGARRASRDALRGGDRAEVRVLGLVVAPDEHVYVRGHVDQVLGIRDERPQRVGRRDALRGIGRVLDGVDVEVIRARVPRIASEDLVERREELARLLPGLAEGPEVPRVEVHERLGEERPHVRVVPVLVPDLAHGPRVGEVQRGAVLRRVLRVAGREGVHERALHGVRARLERAGLLDRLPRDLHALGVHGHAVYVGTLGERDPPVGHGAVGVVARRGLEGVDGLRMVERVDQDEPAVERALRLGARRRDRAVVSSQVLAGRRVALERRRGAAHDREKEGKEELSHGATRVPLNRT